jgi:hypothetical protein
MRENERANDEPERLMSREQEGSGSAEWIAQKFGDDQTQDLRDPDVAPS